MKGSKIKAANYKWTGVLKKDKTVYEFMLSVLGYSINFILQELKIFEASLILFR